MDATDEETDIMHWLITWAQYLTHTIPVLVKVILVKAACSFVYGILYGGILSIISFWTSITTK